MTDPPAWTIDALREYMKQMFKDRDDAIRLAVIELERRLDDLNNAHRTMQERDKTFFPRVEHNAFAGRTMEEIDRLEKAVIDHEKPSYQNWIAAGALLLGVVTGQWLLAIRPYENRLTSLESNDQRIEALIRTDSDAYKAAAEAANRRMDRLYELQYELQHRLDGSKNTAPVEPRR